MKKHHFITDAQIERELGWIMSPGGTFLLDSHGDNIYEGLWELQQRRLQDANLGRGPDTFAPPRARVCETCWWLAGILVAQLAATMWLTHWSPWAFLFGAST